ncbi:fibrinogen-like YCDxxxxGGGW domain-containing protein [Pseudoalteromonas rubra]|uniref:fibrinogen-like YCDxxxxGGGW domain-containing protein n=1 Tax=Pseudoalteromonas rubra TaxID=43658 RepID=UPI000F774532|nr:fibrinogen-like YCDxxxxGGGW domain-containing protein [Pseudoalteromonas rubra]
MKLLTHLCALAVFSALPGHAIEAQVGELQISSQPTAIALDQAFSAPVVFFGLPSLNDPEPGVVSVQLSGDQVNVHFSEWPYLDQAHGTENVPYVVVEKGRHLMPDGSIWEVGTYNQASGAHMVHFSQPFTTPPTVILSPQTQNDAETFSVRAHSVTKFGFASRLYEQESGGSHAAETIGYLAIYSPANSAKLNEQISFRHTSALLSNKRFNTSLGTIFLQEEQSRDTELDHVDEVVGIVEINGHVFATDQSTYGSDSIALRYSAEYKYTDTEFSERNNIALIGTNGLNRASYSASRTYTSDLPSSAFDGWGYGSRIINQNRTEKEARSTWISYANEPQWLEVNMGAIAQVTGIRVVNLTYANRSPKNVVLQVSSDGVHFVDHEQFDLQMTDDTVVLAKPAIAQYFRLVIKSNHGDVTFIKVDEVELYGNLVEKVGDNSEPPVSGTPVTESCNILHQLNPDLPSGEYMIDPDKNGTLIEPFLVYCDMETQGGGWTLFANHQDNIQQIATLPNISPESYGVMESEKWQALRATMTSGYMFKDEFQKVSVLNASTMSETDCRTPTSVTQLDNIAVISDYGTLWHYEASGCSISSLDYSVVLLSDADSSRNASYQYQGAGLIQYASKKFDVWPYSSSVSRDEQNELLYFIK